MFPVSVTTQGRGGSREVCLRRAQPQDAQEIYELVVAVTIDAPRTQAIEADEVRDAAKQRTRIEEALAQENALMLVAVESASGAILGELSAHPGNRRRLAHNLQVGMSVARAARGQGVGRAMLEATLAWARTRPTLTIARLACVASNVAARNLYESCGFRVDGVQPGYFGFADGTFEDDVVMSCKLRG